MQKFIQCEQQYITIQKLNKNKILEREIDERGLRLAEKKVFGLK